KESKNKIKEQRVEFGRVVNTLNDKSMDTINSLKEDFTKDKTASIEKTKKEFNEDKTLMKNQFNRQNSLKDVLYEQRLGEMEKQTNKIIENYENKIAQIAKKAEVEVTAAKGREETRQLKENQANRLSFETLYQEHESEKNQMRDKYESVIARNEALSEQKTNAIIQKYEDKMAREALNYQKEITVKTSEAQSQFERLFKSSELEKENIRSQYEQRIENMKINELKQGNTKKA
ncbi:MAG: hypothetical protein K2Q18_08430, partial [Bdellovibrionales bacterium]|nr:hypothetical protein [Bdellovibrionales bacterium]